MTFYKINECEEAHDIEAAIELDKREDGKEQSFCIRASKFDGETYMVFSHEVNGNHYELGTIRINENLFKELSKTCK